MASPQVENGFLRIAKELAQALMRTNLSAYQSRFLWALWYKTWGWNKKKDWISNSQLVDMTGLAKGNVSRTQKELLMRNIIVINSDNKMAFQKDYSLWKKLDKGARGDRSRVINSDNTEKVINSDNTVINSGKSLSIRVPTVINSGEHKRKKILQKNIYIGCVFCVFDFYCQTMSKNSNQYKFTNKKKSKIKARLKDCSIQEIHDAILACKRSPHHMGRNDQGRLYNDLLKYIIPDREKVEWWWDEGKPSKPKYAT